MITLLLYSNYLTIQIYHTEQVLAYSRVHTRTYTLTYIHTCILIITGVQTSGVIIDRLLRQCCFVWSAKNNKRNKRSMITPEA